MKVRELINWLKDYDEDMMVVVQETGMGYVNRISHLDTIGINTYWGNNVNECLAIKLGSQVGMGTDVQVEEDEDTDW